MIRMRLERNTASADGVGDEESGPVLLFANRQQLLVEPFARDFVE